MIADKGNLLTFWRVPQIGPLGNIAVELECNDLMCKRARFMSVLVSRHFYGSLYEFDACFCLTITLVAVR